MPINELLAMYLNDKSGEKVVSLAETDTEALEALVRFEAILSGAKKAFAQNGLSLKLPEEDILSFADLFFAENAAPDLEIALRDNKYWKTLLSSEADFALFQDILSLLFAYNNLPLIKTPDYLKDIVMKRIYREIPAGAESNSIVIKIKEGLQLITGHLQNVFLLPIHGEAVAVRSSLVTDSTTDNGVLQFFSNEPESGQLIYQVVQDSSETVMLTVKLQNYRPRPKFINIRKSGRLMQSFPMLEDFAYFSQLTSGDYQIELKNDAGVITRQVEIQIV